MSRPERRLTSVRPFSADSHVCQVRTALGSPKIVSTFSRPPTLALLLSLSVAAAACAAGDHPAASPLAATGASGPVHSIDLAAMDKSVPPGTDFFLYANGGWLKSAEIAPDRSSAGVWLDLQKEVENRTKGILEEAAHADAGSELRKIGDYYATFLDEPAIEARGLAPLKPSLEAIAKLDDARALSAFLGAQLRRTSTR